MVSSPAHQYKNLAQAMEHFLTEYGLLAILFCALFENDVTFILTGVIIDRGIVHPVMGVVYCLAGALGHDLFWYWLGHKKSETIRQSRVYRRVGPLVERLALRFGAGELFFCRFIYGTRSPSLVFWGVQRMPLYKFLAIDGLALALWGTFLAALGYFLSDRTAALIGTVKSFEHWLLGASQDIQGPSADEMSYWLSQQLSDANRGRFTPAELAGQGWTLLAQINEDHDADIAIGDGGAFYLHIPTTDLDTGRFDRVVGLMQCH